MTEYKSIREMVLTVEDYIFEKTGRVVRIDMDNFYNPFAIKRELKLLNEAYSVAQEHFRKNQTK